MSSRRARGRGFSWPSGRTRRPNERGGLGSEGLTATPGATRLIGFHNRIPEGCALIVPLFNPTEMLGGEFPKFGELFPLRQGGVLHEGRGRGNAALRGNLNQPGGNGRRRAAKAEGN